MSDDSRPSAIPRHELIAAALQLGIPRPEALTEAELATRIREVSEAAPQDQPRSQPSSSGWLSVARHLLHSIVEQGLNLPTAARALRETMRPRSTASERPPLPTVTLAQIYMSQGHDQKARETLRQVLRRVPGHTKAQQLLDKLDAKLPLAEQRAAREALWDSLVVVRSAEHVTLYWELGKYGRRLRARGAELELEVASFTPSRQGAAAKEERVSVSQDVGSHVFDCDPEVVVRVALGHRQRGCFNVLCVASEHLRAGGEQQPQLVYRPRKGAVDPELVQRALQVAGT